MRIFIAILFMLPVSALAQSMSDEELRALKQNLERVLEDGACSEQEATIQELSSQIQEMEAEPETQYEETDDFGADLEEE